MNHVYSLPKLYKALVLARPSKICKSPYLADIQVYDDEYNVIEENVMAHSPALGCCGLISLGAYVFCTKSESKNEKTKSKYIIHFVFQNQIIEINKVVNFHQTLIGTNPMLANPIVKSLLLNNYIEEFQNISQLKAEFTIDESRFDFTFVNTDGKRVYLEVKNVPLADVIDVCDKDKKKMDLSSYDYSKKIAIFPDGYRKNKDEPVSERALKHVNHLKKIHSDNPDTLCALVFLIQRDDVHSFKPSNLDKIYHTAVYEALEAGVMIIPICVSWSGSSCYHLKRVPLLKK
jgi:DNA-binding sugar fermentation-stimulating protein